MRLQIPSRLIDLLATFAQVQLAFENLPPEALSWLEPRFRARFAPTWQRLSELGERQAVLKSAWTAALAQRRQQIDRLDRMVRDSWLLLRRRDQREQHQGLLVLLYQLPKSAPQHASTTVWLQHARNLLEGEKQACALGHAPLAFPSASELAECLEQASLAEQAYLHLFLALKESEETLRKAQREAAHLLRCLGARIRESQYDQPATETRTLMRCFGFSFKTAPGDADEDVPAQAVATTEAPAALPLQAPAPSASAAQAGVAAPTERPALAEEPDLLPAVAQNPQPKASLLQFIQKLRPNLARTA